MSVITLAINNSTRGAVTGSGSYADGTSITVKATANNGYMFACWSDGTRVVSSTPSYTFTVSGNVTLTAYFYSDVSDVEIYGLCDANCKHRVMNIGQTISLIQEMAANDWKVPEGYVPETAVNGIVEQNTGKVLRLFIGTNNEWKNWTGNKKDVLFLPTDDTTLEELLDKLAEYETKVDNAIAEFYDAVSSEMLSGLLVNAECADGNITVTNRSAMQVTIKYSKNGQEVTEYVEANGTKTVTVDASSGGMTRYILTVSAFMFNKTRSYIYWFEKA